MNDPILAWRFHDAPSVLQFDDNGGDEDWLAAIPYYLQNESIGWLDSNSFGCCERNEYIIDNDGVVWMWSYDKYGNRDFTNLEVKKWSVIPNQYCNCKVVIGCHA